MTCTRLVAGFAALANVFVLAGGCGSEVVNSPGAAGSAGQQSVGEGGGGKGGGSTQGGGGGFPCSNGYSMICSCTCGGREVTAEACFVTSCADLDGERCENGTYEACRQTGQTDECCY